MPEKLKKFWRSLGPGLITGVSDDDPSGVAAYSIAGARTGYGMLWTLVFILPFMIALQEMSARIGALSGCGLAGNIKKHYPKLVLGIAAVGIIIANIFNIGADVAGMASAAGMLLPGVPEFVIAVTMSALILLAMVFLRYRQIVMVMKWLAFLMFSYVIAFFFVHVDVKSLLLNTLIPRLSFDRDTLLVFFAILGTTISPYLYFWQASEEAEELRDRNPRLRVCKFRAISPNRLRNIERDTWTGMIFSNFIAFFIIALTGATLYRAGVTDIETLLDAAEALRPLAGSYAYILFAVGIIGSGLLAIPVLAGSAAYVLAELFGWGGSLDKPFSKARQFYIVLTLSMLLGMLIPAFGISPVTALFWTALLHAVIAPPLILLVIHMANNPAIVGEHRSHPVFRALGYAAFGLLILAGAPLIFL